MVDKRTSKRTSKINLKLSIYTDLKNSLQPSGIKKKYSLSYAQLDYYLAPYKRNGSLKKIAYGTWEFKEDKELQKSTAHTIRQPLKEMDCRGHAFHFKLRIKNVRRWCDFDKMLNRKNIDFHYELQNKTHQFELKNPISKQMQKVWFSRISINIFWAEFDSIFSVGSYEARWKAISEFKLFVEYIEVFFGFSRGAFLIEGAYEFKVAKQHFANVNNTLAKNYRERGLKFRVFTDDGRLRMIADFSLNQDELEFPKSDSAHKDYDGGMRFWNDLLDKPTTMTEIKDLIKLNSLTIKSVIASDVATKEQIGLYASEIAKHREAVSEWLEVGKDIRRDLKKRGDGFPVQSWNKSSSPNEGFECPSCGGEVVWKAGRDKLGRQRFRCKVCRRRFI